MRYSVSDTAEYGDYIGGPQIVTDETREHMKKMLARIQNGEFARQWIDENKKGRPNFYEMRRHEQRLLIEEIGARLREGMSFLKPVTLKAEEPATATTAK